MIDVTGAPASGAGEGATAAGCHASRLSEGIAATLGRWATALETRGGRRAFWGLVICYGVLLGADCVVRAEFPKQVNVGRLHYETPTAIDSPQDKQAHYHSSEFRDFRSLAWGTILEGRDQYSPTDFANVRAYPPFFAIALFPFALPWRLRGIGSALYFLTGYAGGLLTAWCLARWWQRRQDAARFGLFALIWLMLAPFMGAVLGRCESDMLVVTPLAAALFMLTRGRKEMLGGALLGFAASFKVLPGLFGVYLLCQRRWRAAVGMAAVGVACMALLPAVVWGPRGAWQRHVSWYRHVVAPYHEAGASAVIGLGAYRSTNQSLTAAVYRFLTPIRAGKDTDMRSVNFASLSDSTARMVASAMRAFVALTLVALWIMCGGRHETAAERAILFATVPLGMLLLSEVSLGTHHVTMVLPLSVILVRGVWLGDLRARRVLWAVPLVLLICAVGASKTVHLYSPYVAATVLLFICMLLIALRDRMARRRATGIV